MGFFSFPEICYQDMPGVHVVAKTKKPYPSVWEMRVCVWACAACRNICAGKGPFRLKHSTERNWREDECSPRDASPPTSGWWQCEVGAFGNSFKVPGRTCGKVQQCTSDPGHTGDERMAEVYDGFGGFWICFAFPCAFSLRHTVGRKRSFKQRNVSCWSSRWLQLSNGRFMVYFQG